MFHGYPFVDIVGGVVMFEKSIAGITIALAVFIVMPAAAHQACEIREADIEIDTELQGWAPALTINNLSAACLMSQSVIISNWCADVSHGKMKRDLEMCGVLEEFTRFTQVVHPDYGYVNCEIDYKWPHQRIRCIPMIYKDDLIVE